MKKLKNIVPKGFDFTEKEWRESFEKNKPLVVVPFISTKCNIDCIYCMMNEERKCFKGKTMNLEEHEIVLKKAYDLGARTMVITGIGESFLDPVFYNPATNELPLISLAEKIGLYTIIFTNGQMISKSLANELYKRKVSLILKLSSLDQETFSQLNNKLLPFEECICPDGVKRSIPFYLKNLFEAGFGRNLDGNATRLIADVIITKKNIKEVCSIIDMSLKNNMLVCIDPLVVKSKALTNIDKLGITSEENKELFLKVKNTFKNYDMDMYDLSKCIIHYNGLVYDLEGNVRRCLSVPSNVGNVLKDDINEIWKKISEEKNKSGKEYESIAFEDIFGKCPGRCYYNYKNHC